MRTNSKNPDKAKIKKSPIHSREKGDSKKIKLNQDKINEGRKIEKTLLTRFRKQSNQFSEKIRKFH